MSKIPQGEWNAIAARYAQGESISGIAQSYRCTPPAIHYILKRIRQRAGQGGEQPVNRRPELRSGFTRELPGPPTGAELARPVGPPGDEHQPRSATGEGGAAPSEAAPSQAAPKRAGELRIARHGDPASTIKQPEDRRATVVPQQRPGGSRHIARGSAFSAGLDHELHGRVEAAIAAFRSSFDAALTEGSPVVRQQLRQAASELMRVAARTTIVLDRLNTSAERASAPSQIYPHAGENA
jgi:hypothetical protein